MGCVMTKNSFVAEVTFKGLKEDDKKETIKKG